MTSTKLPTDINQRAKLLVDMATDEIAFIPTTDPIEAAVIGISGGLKGGKARANALTATQRSEIAKKAAAKRWEKKER